MSFLDCCANAVKTSIYKQNKPLIYSGLFIIVCGADGTLPKIRDQYINKHIKTVGKLCKINEKLTYDVVKSGKKFPHTVKKYQLITCHTGRRTACTNMYLAGVPTIDIMQISGHTTETNFLKYIKMTKQQTAKRLAKHPYFTNMRVAK